MGIWHTPQAQQGLDIPGSKGELEPWGFESEQERHVSVGGSKHPEPAQPGRKGRLDDAKDGRALPLQILCALHPVSKNW